MFRLGLFFIPKKIKKGATKRNICLEKKGRISFFSPRNLGRKQNKSFFNGQEKKEKKKFLLREEDVVHTD